MVKVFFSGISRPYTISFLSIYHSRSLSDASRNQLCQWEMTDERSLCHADRRMNELIFLYHEQKDGLNRNRKCLTEMQREQNETDRKETENARPTYTLIN